MWCSGFDEVSEYAQFWEIMFRNIDCRLKGKCTFEKRYKRVKRKGSQVSAEFRNWLNSLPKTSTPSDLLSPVNFLFSHLHEKHRSATSEHTVRVCNSYLRLSLEWFSENLIPLCWTLTPLCCIQWKSKDADATAICFPISALPQFLLILCVGIGFTRSLQPAAGT